MSASRHFYRCSFRIKFYFSYYKISCRKHDFSRVIVLSPEHGYIGQVRGGKLGTGAAAGEEESYKPVHVQDPITWNYSGQEQFEQTT